MNLCRHMVNSISKYSSTAYYIVCVYVYVCIYIIYLSVYCIQIRTRHQLLSPLRPFPRPLCGPPSPMGPAHVEGHDSGPGPWHGLRHRQVQVGNRQKAIGNIK